MHGGVQQSVSLDVVGLSYTDRCSFPPFYFGAVDAILELKALNR